MFSILERLNDIEQKITAFAQPAYRGNGVAYSIPASMQYEIDGKTYNFTSMDELKTRLGNMKTLKVKLFKFVPESEAEASFDNEMLLHAIDSANLKFEDDVLEMEAPKIQNKNNQRPLQGTVHYLSITEDKYTPAVSKKKAKTVKFEQPRVRVEWFERY